MTMSRPPTLGTPEDEAAHFQLDGHVPRDAREMAIDPDTSSRLRVALLAGTLARGGAEKQFCYMARALREHGVDVRTYSLTRGEFFESVLTASGCGPHWTARWRMPALRLIGLGVALQRFRPHILQSGHSYANLYVAAVAPLCGAVDIGALRSDARYELDENGHWGRWLLRLPTALIANSYAAKSNADALGVRSLGIYVVPNVIDVSDIDRARHRTQRPSGDEVGPVVATVTRLVAAKRLDRFLIALALARRQVKLRGIIAGDGPETAHLQQLAVELGLQPEGVRFLGERDAAAVWQQADIALLSSDHEGFPNMLLEAMAARLPVVTTPAGDAGVVVQDGVSGYVVPFEDASGMAARLVELARSPDLRGRLGRAGRDLVERRYAFNLMGENLLAAYRAIAEEGGRRQLLDVLASLPSHRGAVSQ